MKIHDKGILVWFTDDRPFILLVVNCRVLGNETVWVVRKPGEDKEISVHTKKQDAMDSAMTRIATWKLQGKIE